MIKWSNAYTEILNGCLLLFLGIAIWVYSGTFPNLDEGYPGPALFPRLISAGFTISGLVLLGIHLPQLFSPNVNQDTAEALASVQETRGYTLFGGIAIVALFPFLSDFLGFLPVVGFSIFGIALLFRINYLQSILIAVGTLGTIYLTFNVLLGVPL